MMKLALGMVCQNRKRSSTKLEVTSGLHSRYCREITGEMVLSKRKMTMTIMMSLFKI